MKGDPISCDDDVWEGLTTEKIVCEEELLKRQNVACFVYERLRPYSWERRWLYHGRRW
jgi:hypothetical protein